MTPGQRGLLLDYGGALLGVALAWLARTLLDPVLGDHGPFAVFFLVVILTAWRSGLGPALVATFLGLAVVLFFFVPPRYQLLPKEFSQLLTAGLYLALGLAVAVCSHIMRSAQRRANLLAAESEVRRAALEAGEAAIRHAAAIVEFSEDAILSKNLSGIVLSWNRAAERLYGYSAAEMIGHSVARLFPPDRLDEMTEILQRIARGEVMEHFETLRRRKDGTLVDVSVNVSPIRDAAQRVVGASTIARGISRQKQSEAEILRLNRDLQQWISEFQTLLDVIPISIAVTDDTDCRRIWTNPTMAQLLRLPQDANASLSAPPSERPTSYRVFQNGRELPTDQLPLHAAVLSGKEVREMEIDLLLEDGTVVNMLSFAAPLFDERGMVRGGIFAGIDLTERKQSQEALLRSEQELADFFENATVGLHWTGPGGIILRANRAELDMLGYQPSEYVGHHISEFHVDPERVEHMLSRLQNGERLRDVSSQLRCKDGSIRDVLIDASVMWEDGRFIHTRTFTRDVTEHKLAVESLADSEQRYRQSDERLGLAQQAGRLGTWEWNIATGQVIWSPSLEAIHGLQPGTFAGTFEAFRSDVHPEDLEDVLDSVNRSLQSGDDHLIEYRLVWPDGSIHWVEARGKLLRDEIGNPVRMVGVCIDIDKRRRLEETLRFLADASAALSGLLEYEITVRRVAELAVPFLADWCAVDMLSPGGELERVAFAGSDAAFTEVVEEIHRQLPNDSNRPHSAHQVLRNQEPELFCEVTDTLLAESVGGNPNLLDQLKRLGIKSWMRIPMTIRGKAAGVITFLTAPSGRSYSLADLELAEELARRAAIAIDNSRLYAEVREADRRKDEFLATLAHELRNPLAPLRNALQLMEMTPNNQEAFNKVRFTMERQLEQMVRLIDDLLDVSRITRNKLELRCEDLNLADVLQSAVESCRPLIDAAGHELELTLPPQPIHLTADFTRLAQVFANLLNNACKYTEPGGRIAVEAKAQNGQVEVRIKDSGIGIPPESLPQIFDMFTQVDGSLERSQGGLGIGLTLVRSLVEMHSGSVTAISEGAAKGSEFIVRLPVMPVREKSTLREGKTPSVSLPRRKILVVDDNKDAADTMTMILRMLGNEVRTVYDGIAAVEAVDDFGPSLILLDIGLPKMNGYDVARSIRSKYGKDIVIAALTGWGQEDDRRRSKESGFDHHLVKPASASQLRNLLAGLPV